MRETDFKIFPLTSIRAVTQTERERKRKKNVFTHIFHTWTWYYKRGCIKRRFDIWTSMNREKYFSLSLSLLLLYSSLLPHPGIDLISVSLYLPCSTLPLLLFSLSLSPPLCLLCVLLSLLANRSSETAGELSCPSGKRGCSKNYTVGLRGGGKNM